MDFISERTGLAETAVFGELVALSLAYNRIRSEADVLALSLLPKLEHLALYGNPLLGEAKEDPSGDAVAGFAAAAAEARDGWTSRALDLSTELPRKRAPRGSQAAASGARGDRRFRDVAMAGARAGRAALQPG